MKEISDEAYRNLQAELAEEKRNSMANKLDAIEARAKFEAAREICLEQLGWDNFDAEIEAKMKEKANEEKKTTI